jgi:hypothetical protein
MLGGFREIVLADFEFAILPGERPKPLCQVAQELRSGRRFRLWQDQFGSSPPYATGSDVLFVAYYASAELGCYRALGWPMPQRILDLFAEFRVRTNMGSKSDQAKRTPAGAKLFGALTYFGLDAVGASEKRELQQAIGSDTWQGRFTPEEILDYCVCDVDALARLLPVMAPQIDLPRALLRGRYMAAASAMEFAGTPIDTETLALLRAGWTDIQDQLIAAIDRDYGVYDGRTFKADRFAACSNTMAFPGHGSRAAGSISAMAPFVRWRAPIRQSRPCASCAVRCPTCASTILPSAATGAIAPSFPRSDHAPGATSRATRDISSARRCGCVG